VLPFGLMDHAFGSDFTVGIEEELLLVDAETHLLTARAAEVLGVMESTEGSAGHEAYAAQIELRSRPCRDAATAGEELRALRAAAQEAGATLMGAGLHPADDDGDSELVDADRYRRVARMMRGLFARTPEAALHVHVGVPDPETAIRVFNGLRGHLPLLQGLSANSPWWFGRDSGLASARYALVRTYPGRGVPAAFPDFDAYLAATEQTLAAGGIDEYTLLWWDVRPHPRLGTVELREMDAQSSVDDVAALGTLVQALAVEAAEEVRGDLAPPSDAIAMSAFCAARDGIDATILDGGRLAPLREVARATVERVRPRARELGTDAPLEAIERIVATGGGAGRQRAAHATGGMRALLEHLSRETRG
jgi:glutamate---cysteine ligase / carboxylate-amine ligase